MAVHLAALCRANMGILSQKVIIIDTLVSKYGPKQARELYKMTCPIVGASIGQHIRHSMDHMELAVMLASTYKSPEYRASMDNNDDDAPTAAAELYYDLRVRGGTLETDMDEARKRVVSVSSEFKDLLLKAYNEKELSRLNRGDNSDCLVLQSVKANFCLTADETDEFGLASTIGRELGFAAHHAIHHMAMVKICAIQTAGLTTDDLPSDFGRAPSTIQHDRTDVS